MIDNVRTQLADLPTSIKAYVYCDQNDYYTIILNSRLSHEENIESYNHELKHIENGDYDKNSSVDLIELWAH